MVEVEFDVPQILANVPKQMIVTSCEEDNSFSDSSSASLKSSNDNTKVEDSHQPEYLFDDQADDEDEAYVYKHLRSGVEECVTVRNKAADGENDPTSPIQRKRLNVLKPRNSDAVLSCPCCFNIVCMDCQQHEYYQNQYRAMFVIGIAVRWDLKLLYDESERSLVQVAVSETDGVKTHQGPYRVPILGSDQNESSNDSNNNEHNGVIYYTVCCANCQTTVAALDMSDEVYYFSGCLASS